MHGNRTHGWQTGTVSAVMGTFIFAAAACSSTPGGGGMGGAGGTGDAGSCNAISLKYASAVAAAVACTPGAPGQCDVLVSPSPTPCPNSQCSDHQVVNDGTAVQSVLKEWLASCDPLGVGPYTVGPDGGPGTTCPNVGCFGGIPATCVPSSPGATTGTCVAFSSDAGAGIAPDGGQSCAELAADYVAAVAAAKSCTPGAPNQCARLAVKVPSSSSSTCLPTTYVNDQSAVDVALGKWSGQCQLDGLFECGSGSFTSTCVANTDAGAAGAGSCVDVQCGPGESVHSIIDDAGVRGPGFCAPLTDGGTDGRHPG